MKKILLLSLLGLFSCQDPTCGKGPDQDTGLIAKVLPNQVAHSDAEGDLGRFGIQISTNETYRRVFKTCCQSQLDSIDFSKFDVLGLSTVNRGSNSSYVLDVQRDDATRKIMYTVTERYCNRSSPVGGRGNFVVVPKLPANYKIEYVRNQ